MDGVQPVYFLLKNSVTVMEWLPPCDINTSGKEFRLKLRKNNRSERKKPKVRVVPAFTIQALQKNTKVAPPPSCNIYEVKPLKPTQFVKSYERGEFPVSIEFTSKGKKLGWRIPIEKLDFSHYLPMFFDGMSEANYPFNFIVEHGINDLVTKGGEKILPVVPQLIIPIKNALLTKRPSVICHALKCIIIMVEGCSNVGRALVPYYRQILPVLNLYISYGRSQDPDKVIRREDSVADLIDDCLQVLERSGGPDAYINIKYQIPTYESCIMN